MDARELLMGLTDGEEEEIICRARDFTG